MASVFKSRAYLQGVPFRPTSEAPFEVTASVLIPNGTALAADDILKFMKIGANVRILSFTLSCSDLDTGAGITLDCGYDLPTGSDNDDAFLAASTVGQAGGTVRVENGGDDAFAVGLLAPQTEVMTIQILVEDAPAGDPATDRYVTVTLKCVADTAAGSITPYSYADRYDNAGVGTI